MIHGTNQTKQQNQIGYRGNITGRQIDPSSGTVINHQADESDIRFSVGDRFGDILHNFPIDNVVAETIDPHSDIAKHNNTTNLLKRMKYALSKFWNKVAKFFGIKSTDINDVADMVLADLLNSQNPNDRDGNRGWNYVAFSDTERDIKVTDHKRWSKGQVAELNTPSEITDEDFTKPYRSVLLPPLPKATAEKINAGNKQVLIKKNIFEKNLQQHPEFDTTTSRNVLETALYGNSEALPDELNLYQKLELRSGKESEHIKSAKEKLFNPIVERLVKNGIEVEDFNRFLVKGCKMYNR